MADVPREYGHWSEKRIRGVRIATTILYPFINELISASCASTCTVRGGATIDNESHV